MLEDGHRVSLPAVECDVLVGLARIAAWIGLTPSQCRHHIANGIVPTYRVHQKPTIFALKSEINAAARDARDRFRQRQKPT